MKSNYTKILLLGFSILLLGICPAKPSFAQQSAAEYTLLAPLPCIPSKDVTCKSGSLSIEKSVDFKQYLNQTINLLIALSAVTAVLMLVYGGLIYMTSESYIGKGDGLKKVKNALYGLLLVLCSYLILKTIDPRLVQIPETIVPKLTIDVPVTDLMKQIELDIQEASNKADLLALDEAKAKKSELEARQDLLEIDQRLAEAFENGSQEEINSLTLLRNQAQLALIDATGDKITAQAKLDFNAKLRDIASAKGADVTSTGKFEGMSNSELIEHFDSDLALLEASKQMYSSRLNELGSYDKTPLNDYANYISARINLEKAKLVTNNAQKEQLVNQAIAVANAISTDQTLKDDLLTRTQEIQTTVKKVPASGAANFDASQIN